jgi:hypothetical protein
VRIAPPRFDPGARHRWLWGALLVALLPLAAGYVELAFTLPSPLGRIALRSLPALPLAVWTLWFDHQRPLETAPTLLKQGGRLLGLLAIMALAVGLLGLGLNWLYDPARVL